MIEAMAVNLRFAECFLLWEDCNLSRMLHLLGGLQSDGSDKCIPHFLQVLCWCNWPEAMSAVTLLIAFHQG